MQITHGLRRVLSIPIVYSSFQVLMGARQGWRRIANEYLKLTHGDAILDIGCGPADVLGYLPEVEYWGFDISQEYISTAKRKFGGRGHFRCKHFDETDLQMLPKFDVALLSGVLHHMSDDEAEQLLRLILKALKPGGRLVTVDPCLVHDQNPIARYLILHDRGQNVRDEAGYTRLAKRVYDFARVEIKHKAWIPYTHCYMVCRSS